MIKNNCKGFPYFNSYLPQWPIYPLSHIKKYLTFDKLFGIRGKPLKVKQEKYTFITYLKLLQEISLLQVEAASMSGIYFLSYKQRSYH